jgi:hypothetical protein
MSDPRVPPGEEAQLPDDLDQRPDAHAAEARLGPHGSEDARLLAEAEEGEGEIEQAAPNSATP